MSNLIETGKQTLTVRTPELIAAEINNIKNQTKKMILCSSIEIGRRLIEAKTLLAHGEWGKWLEESVDYSQRTANNLMKIFDEYGADQITILETNSNSQALANLSYTQAIALLKVPSEEREEFAEENKIEDMSTRELEKLIKEKEEAEKKLKEAENRAKEKEKEATNNKTLYENTQKDLERATQELSDFDSKVEELEKQLEEKPIEINAEIPEEIEEELRELRKIKEDADKEKAVNKHAAKFAVYFEELVSNFKSLLSTLQEIEDAEEKEKYKNAIAGVIGKIEESL